MRTLIVLLLHFITSVTKLLGAGGTKALLAETLVVPGIHQESGHALTMYPGPLCRSI